MAKRKVSLIQEIIQAKDDTLLAELEHIINRNKQLPEGSGSFGAFAGIWSNEEAEEIKKNIKEGCEIRIKPDEEDDIRKTVIAGLDRRTVP